MAPPQRRQARFDEAGGLMMGEAKNANACCALGNGRTSSARMATVNTFFRQSGSVSWPSWHRNKISGNTRGISLNYLSEKPPDY
jgi:hypothetical protein